MFGIANSNALFMRRLRSFLSSLVSVAKLARILSPLAMAPDNNMAETMKIPPSSPESKWAFSVPHMRMEHITPRMDKMVPMPIYFIFSPPSFIIRLTALFRFNKSLCTYTKFFLFQ